MIKRTILPVLLAVFAVTTAIGCQTTPTQQGALLGGALGAGAGAIIGHQQGNQGEGALIGAAAGALTGALIGDQVDERRDARLMQAGHYEVRLVRSPSGELYEQQVWVPGIRTR